MKELIEVSTKETDRKKRLNNNERGEMGGTRTKKPKRTKRHKK